MVSVGCFARASRRRLAKCMSLFMFAFNEYERIRKFLVEVPRTYA
jgi:hypothetical protein